MNLTAVMSVQQRRGKPHEIDLVAERDHLLARAGGHQPRGDRRRPSRPATSAATISAPDDSRRQPEGQSNPAEVEPGCALTPAGAPSTRKPGSMPVRFVKNGAGAIRSYERRTIAPSS